MKDYTWLVVLRWFFGGSLLILSFMNLTEQNDLVSFLLFAGGVCCVPFTFQVIERETNSKINVWVKVLAIVMPCFIAGFLLFDKVIEEKAPSADNSNVVKAVDNSRQESVITGIYGLHAMADGPRYYCYPDTTGYYLDSVAIASVEDIEPVDVFQEDLDRDPKTWGLILKLKDSSRHRLSLYTKYNVGKKLAFVVNSQLITVPQITGRIDNGRVELVGAFKRTDAETLAELINEQIKIKN